MSNQYGVMIFDSQGNNIVSNTISGNRTFGLDIEGTQSNGNQVWGNRIGPASNGSGFPSDSNDPSNPWLQQVGILINDSINNTIGGTTAGSTTPANVIGGNNVGVEISGFNTSLSGSNSILGNDIGIASDGTAIGNVVGIWVNDVPNTRIGGTGSGEGNTISGNSQGGVYISGADATNNMVQGNTIGPGPSGQTGHEKDPTYQFPIGVYIESSSSNVIGGAGSGRETRSPATVSGFTSMALPARPRET